MRYLDGIIFVNVGNNRKVDYDILVTFLNFKFTKINFTMLAKLSSQLKGAFINKKKMIID